jgi:hypothetical protein
MAALLGARGGVQIPDADRRGVYAHLERHYRQFDKEPPELRSLADLAALGPDERRGLFWYGEADDEVPGEVKAGRVLSKRNEDRLRQAGALIAEVLAELGEPEIEEPKSIEIDADMSAILALVGLVEKEN